MAGTGKRTSRASADGALAEPLVAWYRAARRDLPWRRTRDPYAIWVSEVMLQQTQVKTVIPYFERWMKRFPTVEALAAADEHDVLHAWQGLGYYSRARALLAGARAVVERHGGRVPHELEQLRALPGVGPYTAGAICSIAFGERAAIVDGNVARVLTRLFALEGDPARAPLKNELWRLAYELVPAGTASDFNQALMELGATVCTPKQPACVACPVRSSCRAWREGRVGELPTPKPRRTATPVLMAAAVIQRRGRVLVARRPDDAPRWAGMWLFPMTELERGEPAERGAERAAREAAGIDVVAGERVARVRHAVTRYLVTLDAHRCELRVADAAARRSPALCWKRPEELASLALPVAHQRIAAALLAGDEPAAGSRPRRADGRSKPAPRQRSKR